MTATPIECGARVRLIRDYEQWRKGSEFTIEDYVEPPSEAEREPGDFEVPHYWANSAHGFNDVCVPVDSVELVQSAAAMRARVTPTHEQIRNAISIALLGDFDGFSTDETNREGKASVQVYGTTAEGLPFGFQLTVESIWETD